MKTSKWVQKFFAGLLSVSVGISPTFSVAASPPVPAAYSEANPSGLYAEYQASPNSPKIEIFTSVLIPDHPAWAWLLSQIQKSPTQASRGRIFWQPSEGQQGAPSQVLQLQAHSGAPMEALPTLSSPEASQRNQNFDYGKGPRLFFSLIKTVVVGAGPFWAVYVGQGHSLLQASIVGLVFGAMSGSLLYWGPKYHAYLTQNLILEKWLSGSRAEVKRIAGSFEEVLRWDLSEVAYVSLGELAMRASQVAHSPDLLTGLLQATVAAQYSTITQSFWDLALAKIKFAQANRSPNQAAHWQKVVDLTGIGISFSSVGLAVAKLLHHPQADFGFLVFGLTGVGVYLYSLYHSRKSNAQAKKLPEVCQALLQ